MELFIICVFAVILLVCILTDVGLIEALLIGYGLFFYYSWRKGFSVREILGFSWNGISTIKNILYTFLLSFHRTQKKPGHQQGVVRQG